MTLYDLNGHRAGTIPIEYSEAQIVWLLNLLEQQQLSKVGPYLPGSTAHQILLKMRAALRTFPPSDEAA